MKKLMQIAHSEYHAEHAGDQPVAFDTEDATATAEARALFDRLTGAKGVAFNVNADGSTQGRVENFDDLAERSILIPKFAGG